jgi:hypothetical protein
LTYEESEGYLRFCQRLLFEIIKDYLYAFTADVGKLPKKSKMSLSLTDIEDTLYYVESDNENSFSFVFLCYNINIEPEVLRFKLKDFSKYIKKNGLSINEVNKILPYGKEKGNIFFDYLLDNR